MLVLIPKRAAEGITFFVTSDTHYGLSQTVAAANEKTVDAMNALPGTAFPREVGGAVATPRGVAVLGDLTNDGDTPGFSISWRLFNADFGVNGEGRLRFPVYELPGNHDGGDEQTVRRGIRERNKLRPGLEGSSPNGISYSWDWGQVHFVSLGLFAGSEGDEVVNPGAAGSTAGGGSPATAWNFSRRTWPVTSVRAAARSSSSSITAGTFGGSAGGPSGSGRRWPPPSGAIMLLPFSGGTPMSSCGSTSMAFRAFARAPLRPIPSRGPSSWFASVPRRWTWPSEKRTDGAIRLGSRLNRRVFSRRSGPHPQFPQFQARGRYLGRRGGLANSQ